MSRLDISGQPRPLGRSQQTAFPIAYGFWRFAGTDVKTARAKVEAALECGVTLFDHADVYGCDGGGAFGDAEALFGEVLAEAPHLRDRMTIATKGGIVLGVPYDSSAEYIRSAVDASLKRLRIECIDLYQIHRPDFLGHPRELAEVLTSLRDEGKIVDVGVSNYTLTQFNALQAWLPFPIATRQPEFSCWQHSAMKNGILDQCMEKSVTPLAWSPFAGGRLGCTLEEAARTDGGERLVHVLKELDHIAQAQDTSRAAVALAWILAHPAGVIPILGTQRIERIKDSMGALSVEMDRTTWNRILVAAQGEPLP